MNAYVQRHNKIRQLKVKWFDRLWPLLLKSEIMPWAMNDEFKPYLCTDCGNNITAAASRKCQTCRADPRETLS